MSHKHKSQWSCTLSQLDTCLCLLLKQLYTASDQPYFYNLHCVLSRGLISTKFGNQLSLFPRPSTQFILPPGYTELQFIINNILNYHTPSICQYSPVHKFFKKPQPLSPLLHKCISHCAGWKCYFPRGGPSSWVTGCWLMLFVTREWCSMIYVIILHFPPLMFVLKVIWNTLPLANYLLLAAMHCSVGLRARVRASKAAGKKEGGREEFIAYVALCHGHVAWKPLSISVNCLWLKAFLIGYAKTQFEVFAQALWI